MTNCQTHGTSQFRACPSCHASRRPIRTARQTKEAIIASARRAGRIRAIARMDYMERYWGNA